MLNKINFTIHLNDLKYHLILYFFILLEIIFILFFYNIEIIYILIKPLLYFINSNYFIFTNITELFLIKIIVITYCSFFISTIFLIFQIWIFLSKGLFKKENIIIIKYLFILIIIIFFLNYTILNIIIPYFCNFFVKFEKYSFIYNIQLEPKIYSYLLYIIKIIILINFFFQVPFILSLCISFKIISINFFFKFRKIIYFIIFIVSSIISPPDIFSQCFLSLFIIFFLENLIFFKFFYK